MNPQTRQPQVGSAPDLAVVEEALGHLTETAPAGLAHSALVAVGLADDYTVLDSPVGPLRIAWNGRGVSTVDGATDDEAFALRFEARTGRPIRRYAHPAPGDRAPTTLRGLTATSRVTNCQAEHLGGITRRRAGRRGPRWDRPAGCSP